MMCKYADWSAVVYHLIMNSEDTPSPDHSITP